MLDTPQYFSGQGRILVAKRQINGRPGAFALFADCSAAKFSPKVDTEEIDESMTGQRLTARILEKKKSAALTVTCKQFTKTSATLGFYSQSTTIASGSVTGELLPPGLVAGDEVGLAHGNVSALVITDSAGTPATAVLGTNYKLNSAVFGNVGIITPGALEQPFKAAYSYAQAETYPIFSQTPEERYVRIEGLNTAEDNAPVLIEYYMAKPAPFSSVDWISDSASNQDVDFNLLYDPLNGLDPNFGFFGRVTFL